MMDPGWSRMLEKVLPGIINKVTAVGYVPDHTREGCTHV